MTHPSPKRNMVPKAVLMRSGLVSLTTARPVNTAQPRTTVNSARPMTNVFNKAHSTVRRPINNKTTTKNSNFNKRVNTVSGKNVNIARPKAVVNAARPKAVLNVVKGNQVNVVKALACWVWKPKTKGNPQQDLEEKGVIDSGCSRHMTWNIVARTPQQNRVAKRKNRTLIEAARTMLADSKLPTTFWAEAVNTACYVQNRVLVTKPHNKTPYELFLGRKPALGFMRPFGCHVTILNTIDHLGKFDGKADEGFFDGYSISSKAFRVFNSRTRIVEENLHVYSKSSPYAEFKPSGDDEKKVTEEPRNEGGDSSKDDESNDQEKDDNVNSNNNVNAASTNEVNAVGRKSSIELPDDLNMPELEDIVYSDDDEDVGTEVDMNNLDAFMPVSPIQSTRIHKDHPVEQIIEDLNSTPQTRRMTKNLEEHEEFYICQPPGFEDPDSPDRMYHIWPHTKKSLCTVEKMMHKEVTTEFYGVKLHFLLRTQTETTYGNSKALLKDEDVKKVDTHPCAKKNMVPRAVLMKFGLVSINTARQVNAAHTKTTVNAAKPMPKAVVNAVMRNNINAVKASACWIQVSGGLGPQKKLFFLSNVQGNPQIDLQDQGVIDSGCSRHMSYLTNYEEIDGGYVAFGGNPKGGKITRKDEAVYKELDDSLVRAATTASSLEAEQDNGGGPKHQETIGDTIAQTRFENISKLSNDPLLARGKTLRSGEDSLKLNELMELCTNLQTRVIDLEKTKTTQAEEIVSLKRRVKKLKQKKRSRNHGLKRLYKVGLTARVESSGDEESLGEDASKQGRINAIDTDYQLAQRLQAEEQEQFTTKQKATLFKELLEQRRKHFAAKRAEEKRNKPPTQA
ncbi:retrovirus-related pol polyprotein from transposon TNT 1-94 [Tanacetum coccineum]